MRVILTNHEPIGAHTERGCFVSRGKSFLANLDVKKRAQRFTKVEEERPMDEKSATSRLPRTYR